MKNLLKIAMMAAAGLAMAGGAQAQQPSGSELGRNFLFRNNIRIEYDDNIYESNENKQDSFVFYEEPEFIYNLNLQDRTYVGLRYRPSFVLWENREPDDSDINHNFNFDFVHNFTPRLSISLKDAFLYAMQPELMDRGVKVAENGDYLYNYANADLTYLVAPRTRMQASGRYTILKYDDEDYAANEDYDIIAGGLSLRREMTAASSLSGDYRYEDVAYDNEIRGAASHYVGAGWETVFNPALVGTLRGGAQFKEFQDENIDSDTGPYVDLALTWLPAPSTRLTLGAGYSMFEADVYPFANQDRLLAYANVSHDLTARVSLYLTGSYQISEYDGEQIVDSTSTIQGDGEENVWQVSARASYRIGSSDWIEANYSYQNLESDVREDFDRNRISLGWRTAL